MNSASIRNQIKTYHQRLQNREDTDPGYLNEESKELRHKIMYAHLRVEQTMQITLAQNIIKIEFKKKNAQLLVEYFGRVAPIFDNMEFYAKLNAIKALQLFPKKIINLISKVNDHRKYFSHPASYQNKIKEYKNPEKQLATLKDLDSALNELDKYILDKKLVLED